MHKERRCSPCNFGWKCCHACSNSVRVGSSNQAVIPEDKTPGHCSLVGQPLATHTSIAWVWPASCHAHQYCVGVASLLPCTPVLRGCGQPLAGHAHQYCVGVASLLPCTPVLRGCGQPLAMHTSIAWVWPASCHAHQYCVGVASLLPCTPVLRRNVSKGWPQFTGFGKS